MENNRFLAKEEIAARLKEVREEILDITQVEMAKRLNVARQTYLDLETGKTDPRMLTLIAIAEMADIPIDFFAYKYSQQDSARQLLNQQAKMAEKLARYLVAITEPF